MHIDKMKKKEKPREQVQNSIKCVRNRSKINTLTHTNDHHLLGLLPTVKSKKIWMDWTSFMCTKLPCELNDVVRCFPHVSKMTLNSCI